MHSYIIYSKDRDLIKSKIEKLASDLKAKLYEMPGKKIEEIRNLNKFVSLSLSQKTAVVIWDIDLSTNEAMNAFLKNLEEPQKNLYYFLTASNIYKVLPTIKSRCQIIHLNAKNYKQVSEKIDEFISGNLSAKFKIVDSLKKREDAIIFLEDLINHIHSKLTDNQNLYKNAFFLKLADDARNKIKGNGNVSLQLNNLVVNTS